MKLTISQQIQISLPEATSRTVLHVLLTPRSGPSQTVKDWHVTPQEGADSASFADAFGNIAHLVAQGKPPQEWTVTAGGTVETEDKNGVLGRLPGEPMPRLYLRQTSLTRPTAEFAAPFRNDAEGSDTIALLHKLMNETPGLLRKMAREEKGTAAKADDAGAEKQEKAVQSQEQSQGESQMQTATLTAPASASRPGAPELTHAFVGLVRALNIPARYVTGYLGRETATAPSMHAWAEVFDTNLGWIGFDPMLQLCPTDTHVRVACGLDAHSAAPLRSVPVALAPPTAKLTVEIAKD